MPNSCAVSAAVKRLTESNGECAEKWARESRLSGASSPQDEGVRCGGPSCVLK